MTFFLIGWWWDNSVVSWAFCAELKVAILHLGGSLSSAEEIKILLCIFLEEAPGPCLQLHYCFFIFFFFFKFFFFFLICSIVSWLLLHWLLPFLPSLISSCLNLSFGTQGRSRRLKEHYFLQTRNREHGNELYQGGHHRVLLHFISVQFSSVASDSLQPHGLQHARPPCPSPTLRIY